MTFLGRRTRRLPGYLPVGQIALQHRVDRGAPSRRRRRRNRSTLADHCDAAAVGDEIVERVERARAIHPMKRIAHRDEAELSQLARQVLRAAESPLDVADAAFACDALALGTHRIVGIHREDFIEQMRERNRDGTGAATEIEQPAGAVEPKILAQNPDERRRILGAIPRVVPRGAFVDGQVILVAFTHWREGVIARFGRGACRC